MTASGAHSGAYVVDKRADTKATAIQWSTLVLLLGMSATAALGCLGAVGGRVVGVVLMVVALADVFLKVLHARMSTGVVGAAVAYVMWRAERADAAELVAHLGPRGQFAIGYTDLSSLANDLTAVNESHHFYPALFYFRFRDPLYTVSRFTMLALDAATLIESALADEPYLWLKESGAVRQLRQAAFALLSALENTFIPGGAPERHEPQHAQRVAWREHYFGALARLRSSQIATVVDEEAGAARYVALRAEWNGLVYALAPAMELASNEVDPVMCQPRNDDDVASRW
jgi:hypothetical protein